MYIAMNWKSGHNSFAYHDTVRVHNCMKPMSYGQNCTVLKLVSDSILYQCICSIIEWRDLLQ